MRRISQSRRFVPGGESLASIERDYLGKFTHKSLYNHVAKHQAPTKVKLEKQIKQFEIKQALKDITGDGASRRLAVYSGHNAMRRSMLEKGLQALEDGDMVLTAAVMAQLLKRESDIEEKGKDRGLEMMKMFNYFASGAGGPGTPNPAPDIEEGELA